MPPSLNSRLSAAGSAAPAASRRSGTGSSGRASLAGSGTASVKAAGSIAETLIPVGSEQDNLEPLRPGRNYSYQLGFSNPLYEDIEVLVELAEPVPEDDDDDDEEEDDVDKAEEGGQQQEQLSAGAGTQSQDPVPGKSKDREATKAKRHWQAAMPGTSFSISALDDAWQYDAHDEDDDDGDGALHGERERDTGLETAAGESAGIVGVTGIGGSGGSGRRRKRYGPGILAKRGNKTVVQLDLVVGREASGVIRVSGRTAIAVWFPGLDNLTWL